MNPTLPLETIESDTTNSNLERGRVLYQKGCVKNLNFVTENLVLAKVKGHKTYKVLIEYKENVYNAYCNCLYEPKGSVQTPGCC